MCSVSVAGVSAVTNQSLVNAAADRRGAEGTTIVVGSDQRAARAPPRRGCGRTRAASARRARAGRPAQISAERVSCAAAGECNACAKRRNRHRRGREHGQRRDHARALRVEPLRPVSRPPTRNARPSTSTLFARIDPTSAACTTFTSPSLSAKSAMKSSGRLPSADWTMPARAGAERGSRAARSPCRRGARARRSRPPRRRTRARREPGVVAEPGEATSRYAVRRARSARAWLTGVGTYQARPSSQGSRKRPGCRHRSASHRSRRGTTRCGTACSSSTIAVVASALASTATASDLIDRNANGVTLVGQREGRGADQLHRGRQAAARARLGRAQRDRADAGRDRRCRSALDYAGGWGKYKRDYWKTFRNACTAYTGPGARVEGDGVHGARRLVLGAAGVAADAPELRARADRHAERVGTAPLALDGRAARAPDRHRLGVAAMGPPLRHVHVRRRSRLRLPLDVVGRAHSTRSGATSTSTRSTRRTARAGSARTAS